MTTQTTRPVVFVGSSAEGLPVARALQQNLDHEAEVILWSQGIFGLSSGTLETLVDKARQFDFAALDFTSPENVAFRCRLRGLDEEWLDVNAQRTVSYGHILPGDYRFQVIACSGDGVWN